MKRIIALMTSALMVVGAAGCSYGSGNGEYPVQVAGYTFEQSFKDSAKKAPFSVQKGGR